jgi:hypothetical protein
MFLHCQQILVLAKQCSLKNRRYFSVRYYISETHQYKLDARTFTVNENQSWYTKQAIRFGE